MDLFSNVTFSFIELSDKQLDLYKVFEITLKTVKTYFPECCKLIDFHWKVLNNEAV